MTKRAIQVWGTRLQMNTIPIALWVGQSWMIFMKKCPVSLLLGIG